MLDQVADAQPSPSEIVSRNEELALLKTSLTDAERQIFELRTVGFSWNDVAKRLGGSAPGRRMQLHTRSRTHRAATGFGGLEFSACGLPVADDRD